MSKFRKGGEWVQQAGLDPTLAQLDSRFVFARPLADKLLAFGKFVTEQYPNAGYLVAFNGFVVPMEILGGTPSEPSSGA